MGTRVLELANGKSIKKVPDNIRLTGVLFNGERQQYKLNEERHLQTRQPITGNVEVLYEKTTFKQPVNVAAYWPLTPSEPTQP